MMAQNARNHARMCIFRVKIFNVVLATAVAGKRLLKLLKLNNSFIVSFL